jgi:hypothetical protein
MDDELTDKVDEVSEEGTGEEELQIFGVVH